LDRNIVVTWWTLFEKEYCGGMEKRWIWLGWTSDDFHEEEYLGALDFGLFDIGFHTHFGDFSASLIFFLSDMIHLSLYPPA